MPKEIIITSKVQVEIDPNSGARNQKHLTVEVDSERDQLAILIAEHLGIIVGRKGVEELEVSLKSGIKKNNKNKAAK